MIKTAVSVYAMIIKWPPVAIFAWTYLSLSADIFILYLLNFFILPNGVQLNICGSKPESFHIYKFYWGSEQTYVSANMSVLEFFTS